MKKKIIEALATKFAGVNEKTLDRIAEKLAKTIDSEEEIATAVEGVTFQQVLESYGDSRANEAAETAVTNYEKKYKLKKGVKVEEPKPEPKAEPTNKTEEDMPAWAQALLDKNKALEDKLTAMQTEKLATGRKAQLAKVLENAPDKLKSRYQKDFDRLNFADDDDFNAWLGETKSDIEEVSNQLATAGGVVTKPKGGNRGGNNNEVNPIVKARIEAKSNGSAPSAIAGLQQTIK